MLFVDYTFTLVGEHVQMDRELSPEVIKVKNGDRFIAHVEEHENNGKTYEQVTFIKHPEDIRT